MDLLVTNKELVLDSQGRATTVDGVELVAQRIYRRLNTHSGEWSLNVTVGMDYRGAVMRKSPNLQFVRDLMIACISSVEGVLRVKKLELELSSRLLRVSFEVVTLSGDLLLASGSGTDTISVANSLSFVGVADAYYRSA